ncbi:MAG: hypothetical protein GY696_39275 [Gammaproteobacteria bacterium]|nr:hypothetical protein [Gammaproteobacteria bacterium]
MVLWTNFNLPDGLAALLDDYLSGRNQTVKISNEQSAPTEIISGVPQGSILGPHLFNAYITSVLNLQLSENSRMISFADDLLLVKPIMTVDDELLLQGDINKILESYGRLNLTLNPSKSKYMICTMAPAASRINLENPPEIQGAELCHVNELRYLGVLIDQKLTFGPQVEHLSARAKKAAGALWRVLGRWASKELFADLCTKKILPMVTYALPVACPTTIENIGRFWKNAAILCTACNKRLHFDLHRSTLCAALETTGTALY